MARESNFPASVKFLDLAQYSRDVADIPFSKELRFRTSGVRTFTPTSMIFFAKTCRRRVRASEGKEHVFFHGLSKHSYANNFGFSDALKLEGKPYPQGAFGGKGYVPMSTMSLSHLEEVAALNSVQVGDAIEAECETIANVAAQERSSKLTQLLQTSFREIFRNVFEHSQCSTAGYCAQYWPTRDAVEICISDRGIGFANSLAEDRYFSGLSDYEALLMSLMPGVSSKARLQKKRPRSQRTEWDNSGYGLYFVHRLASEFGWFGMASGKSALFIENGVLKRGACDVEGAIVSLRLKLSDPDAIEKKIDSIRTEAEQTKQRMGVRNLTPASVEAFLARGGMQA